MLRIVEVVGRHSQPVAVRTVRKTIPSRSGSARDINGQLGSQLQGLANYLKSVAFACGVVPLPYHDWRRPLSRPIVIPKVMTLEMLENVRALVHRHLPAEYRSKQAWQRVASILGDKSLG